MINRYKTNGAKNLMIFCFNPKFYVITDIYYFEHQASQGYGQVNNERNLSGAWVAGGQGGQLSTYILAE